MKFLDRVALNRTIAIILGFIISVLKMFMPKIDQEIDDNPTPPLPKPPIWKRGRKKKESV